MLQPYRLQLPSDALQVAVKLLKTRQLLIDDPDEAHSFRLGALLSPLHVAHHPERSAPDKGADTGDNQGQQAQGAELKGVRRVKRHLECPKAQDHDAQDRGDYDCGMLHATSKR
jgi:hypothetical protein